MPRCDSFGRKHRPRQLPRGFLRRASGVPWREAVFRVNFTVNGGLISFLYLFDVNRGGRCTVTSGNCCDSLDEYTFLLVKRRRKEHIQRLGPPVERVEILIQRQRGNNQNSWFWLELGLCSFRIFDGHLQQTESLLVYISLNQKAKILKKNDGSL